MPDFTKIKIIDRAKEYASKWGCTLLQTNLSVSQYRKLCEEVHIICKYPAGYSMSITSLKTLFKETSIKYQWDNLPSMQKFYLKYGFDFLFDRFTDIDTKNSILILSSAVPYPNIRSILLPK